MVRYTPRPLYPRGKSPCTHWIGRWVGPRTGLDDVENRKFLTLPELEFQPLCCPVRRQSLYRLRYLGSSVNLLPKKMLVYLVVSFGHLFVELKFVACNLEN
jgi:hypothetical protein